MKTYLAKLWLILVIGLLGALVWLKPVPVTPLHDLLEQLPTDIASTPKPDSSATPVEQTSTPTPLPTPTPYPTLPVGIEDFRNVQVKLAYFLESEAANELESLVQEFNRSNEWKIRVSTDLAWSYADLQTEILAANQQPTSSSPDLVIAEIEQIAAWGESGILSSNLDAFFHDPELGMKDETRASAFQPFWNTPEQNNWRLPIFRSSYVMVYNRTWAHALGFSDPPLTTDDFLEQACAAAAEIAETKSPLKRGLGGWFMSTHPVVGQSWLQAFSASPLYSSEQQVYSFDTNEHAEAFDFLRLMAERNCAWNNAVPRPEDSVDPFIYIANREALLAAIPMEDLPLVENAMQVAENNDDWVVLPFPSADGFGQLSFTGFDAGLLSPDHQKQLAGWTFLRWLNAEPQSSRLAQAAGTFPLYLNGQNTTSNDSHYSQALALQPVIRANPLPGSWTKLQSSFQDALWENMIQYQLISGVENVKVRSARQILQELDSLAENQP